MQRTRKHKTRKQFKFSIKILDKNLYKQLENLKQNEFKGKSWNVVLKKILEEYFIAKELQEITLENDLPQSENVNQFKRIISITDSKFCKQLYNLKNNEFKDKPWYIFLKTILKGYFITKGLETKVSEEKVLPEAIKTIENKLSIENEPIPSKYLKPLPRERIFLNQKLENFDKISQNCLYLLSDFGILFGPGYEVFYCIEEMGEITNRKIRSHLKCPALCRACQKQKEAKRKEKKAKEEERERKRKARKAEEEEERKRRRKEREENRSYRKSRVNYPSSGRYGDFCHPGWQYY